MKSDRSPLPAALEQHNWQKAYFLLQQGADQDGCLAVALRNGADEEVLAAAFRVCNNDGRYPDSDAIELRRAIADAHGVGPERVVCARGAMELISLLATTYLEPGCNAVGSEYGYLYFKTAIELAGADCLVSSEIDLTVDVDAMAAMANTDTRLVFLANPANPSGTMIGNDAIFRLREKLPDSALLVIDEAYAEYAEPEVYHSNFHLAESSDTAILRTFSKIYGLAGFRIGWGVFPDSVLPAIRAVLQPNSLPSVSQSVAAISIRQQNRVSAERKRNQNVRESFANRLNSLGLKTLPAHGNFLLVKFSSDEQAKAVQQYLRDHGIMVRPMDSYQLPDYLRITIGSASQMRRVENEIEDYLTRNR